MSERALGELEQLLLFALVEPGEPAYGVTVRELIEEETGRALSPGAVHTGYERLERRGFVESWLGEATPVRGGRPKRFYRITGAGARALQESYRRLTGIGEDRLGALERLAAGSD